ncbi:SpvB/TcaC N-terminal domain-containing protein [Nostoc sp. ChiQUE01b]|uniref:SpvB/TcaC N-terminal domain-containing protein n=1 Tax=Nostoc sp. ChiQUE01b TaxID=3075376 RepID=UPI002AD38DA8|nr:SpvB/TcaC N-terminal domain-containing protein [Nostoc sp. ChiQUE01b]MDZ8263104.1 SpvB/TcaC N-terminal domain-containing protein [Nostoc sp. ChiQUE01b]
MLDRPSQNDSKPATEQDKNYFAPPQAVSLPKGGGAIKGMGEKFAANPVTGTGSMSVPIATSPGRSGFDPQLSLSYDSGAGNGIFGMGWSLSLPSITRKTDKGLPRYWDSEESDVFLLSGAEDLVPVLKADGTVDETIQDGYRIRKYRPRIEGLFARIERWTNVESGEMHWRSLSKDNITTLYGKTDESRIADPADPTHVFSWLISESYDDKGNAIRYSYKPENSQGIDIAQAHEHNRMIESRSANRYLKHIYYGNRTPRQPDEDLSARTDWLFEVVFDYGEHDVANPKPSDAGLWTVRNDPFSSYRSGFEVRTYRLCQRVLMFHHFRDEAGVGSDCLVRSTDFTYAYEQNPTDVRSPVYSFLKTVTQTGYKRAAGGGYIQKSLPPLELTYSEPNIDETVREVDRTSLENLPYGLDGTRYQWIDLDGEGLSGILTEQGNGWFYKRNLSPINAVQTNGKEHIEAQFAPVELVARKPASGLADGAQFLDLAGNGQPDLVMLRSRSPGFYERTADEHWNSFIPFKSLPIVDWDNPNLKFIDLDGDGHTDILITEDDCFVWHSSLAEDGFGVAERVRQSWDEEKGPRVVFADGTQSIYLADMSGDGLTDIVRIRNGEVCYWANLGYGQFGAKVTMDNAPWFDAPDIFNQRRILLADIDGSGTTDILYLSGEGVQVYFNQSGNSWSAKRVLRSFPAIDNVVSVTTLDLLGNGTACLVWSSPLPGHTQRVMRYIDLMGGQKPHLLIKTVNNMGAETVVQYAPSTKFYLEDRLAGTPWVTKLPFPVHVVERVETYDRISRNRFVTRYAYHHGYFDGEEREFRGFGMVEQFDTEEFAALSAGDTLPVGDNIDAASHVPPVHTKTWFHTGVYLDRNHVSNFFAGLLNEQDTGEYYREEPGLTDAQARQLLLADTVLPAGLTVEEEREACRALKGSMLRQEVYAQDGTDKAEHPYTVTEQNFTISVLQKRGDNRHAVFFTHAREAINYHYERNPSDPRVSYALTLEVDDFGNVLKQVAIAHGRRQPDLNLPLQVDRDKQTQVLVTYTENRVTNAIDTNDDYRTPLPCETRTYELTNYTPTGVAGRFQSSDFVQPDPSNSDNLVLIFDSEINYEDQPTSSRQRRLIEQVQTLYRPNDLGTAQNNTLTLLPLGQVESLAIPGESYKLAFTPGLLTQVFQRSRQGQPPETLLPNPANVIGGQGADRGGYVDLDSNGHWWIPSGRMFHSPNSGDTPAQELAHARQHFFLSYRNRDPFGAESFMTYDAYDLLMLETRDPVGNRVTVGERDENGNLTTAGNDYRVLQPWLLMDANWNRATVAFDALGMVVGTAVMGKPEENLGDSLTGFETDLSEIVVLDHVDNPLTDPHSILQRSTTRLVYDLFAYHRTKDDPNPQPAVVYTLARETHDADLNPGEQTEIQHSFSYSDGFGREIQKKIQAEPGPLDLDDPNAPTVDPRWVGSGWTIFNNKGKPVRQYEPFFSDTHRFEFARIVGVSPILFYDPIERVVATLHPNHTYEKVVFDPWQQVTWDVNDTVTSDPRTDTDIQEYVSAYFATQSAGWQTWHGERQGAGGQEQVAATKAAAHADTPTTAYFDTLGRLFLTLAHNGLLPDGTPDLYPTRVELDIEGNQRAVRDAIVQAGDSQGRVVMRYDYDLLGNRIHQASMEAGERWMLNNVAGNPIRAWNSRGHAFRTEYDPLRRPLRSLVTGANPANPTQELITERLIYGEQHPENLQRNLRGKLYLHLDQAGVVANENYDFKSNLRQAARRLKQEYRQAIDWMAIDTTLPSDATATFDAVALETDLAPRLEADTFTSQTTYDALNRPVTMETPDNSVIHPFYNKANFLERVEVNLQGSATPTVFVNDIDYDAKGQRTRIEYGNGVTTTYEYDPLTFRLVLLQTLRGTEALQDLEYTYDPVGNITHIRDDAQQTIYFRNRRVEPSNDYTYDAIYRLIEATGREHLGQTGGQRNAPTPPDAFNSFHTRLDHPGDGDAMGTYVEQYVYDAVGNILSMQHRGSDPAHAGWTRTYAYTENSLLEPIKQSNRLSNTTIARTTPQVEPYLHDVHGNMIRMPHLANHPDPNAANMHWNYRDQLRQVDLGGGGTAYYTYDASGQRVRKVWEKSPGLVEERIYLSGFEIFRRRNGAGTVTLERETLHIMDDKQRIALVKTRTIDTTNTDPAPAQLIRYQLGNHLGSSAVELDDQAQIISYEEYTPYGSTSYQAVRSQTETPKRYRYTGKERDEESGLYYYGARYNVPSLGRWVSCDPAGLVDGSNQYSFCRGNPICLKDRDGKESLPPEIQEAWDAAERANFDDASVERLIAAYEAHRDQTGQQLVTSQSALEYATVRAVASVRHWEQGNYFSAIAHGALGVTESFGYAIFGETHGETVRNAAVMAGLGVALGRLAQAGRASQARVAATQEAWQARAAARRTVAPPPEPPASPPRPSTSQPEPSPSSPRTSAAVSESPTPPEGVPVAPRLVDRSIPGERYFVQDTANQRFYAEGTVSPRGELSISIRTRLETGERSILLRGAEQFQRILQFFQGKFTSIKGNWQYGTNLARVNELTGQGLTLEQAAAQTWTGQQATAAGFANVHVVASEGTSGAYTSVQVRFTQ